MLFCIYKHIAACSLSFFAVLADARLGPATVTELASFLCEEYGVDTQATVGNLGTGFEFALQSLFQLLTGLAPVFIRCGAWWISEQRLLAVCEEYRCK